MTPEQRKERARKAGLAKKGHKASHTIEAAKTKEFLIAKIKEDFEEFYQAAKDSALGHLQVVTTPSGRKRVYKTAPNAVMLKDFFDRAFGKPTQPIEGSLTVKNDLSERAQSLLHEFREIEDTINSEDSPKPNL